jgi:hypothetical protein
VEGTKMQVSYNQNDKKTPATNMGLQIDSFYIMESLFRSKDAECSLWAKYCNRLELELNELKEENKVLKSKIMELERQSSHE